MRLSSPENLPGVPRLRGAHPLVHFANAFAPAAPTATYIAGVKGQQDLSFQGYATLPAAIVDQVRNKINSLS